MNCNVLFDATTVLEDHEYFKCSTSDYVLAYVCGLVELKSIGLCRIKDDKKVVSCSDWFCSLVFGDTVTVAEFYKRISLKRNIIEIRGAPEKLARYQYLAVSNIRLLYPTISNTRMFVITKEINKNKNIEK